MNNTYKTEESICNSIIEAGVQLFVILTLTGITLGSIWLACTAYVKEKKEANPVFVEVLRQKELHAFSTKGGSRH